MLRSFLLRFTLPLALLAGCAAPTETEDAQTSADGLTVDRRGGDVTVLQAWIGDTLGRRYPSGYQLGDHALDLSRCHGTDCSSAASDVLDSTLVGGFRYSADSSGQCETLEVRTIVKKAAFDAPTFKGIGFYASTLGGRMGFVSKQTLVFAGDVGTVTLRDGSQALVHRFALQGMCFGLGGNGGSVYRRNYRLRPFAQFDVTETDREYRVWDDVGSDYFIGRKDDGGWVQSFDRQGELLRP